MALPHTLARLTALSLLVGAGASLLVGCSSVTSTSTSTGSSSSSSSSSGAGISSEDLRVCALFAGCSGVVGAGMTFWCEPVEEIEVGGNMPNRSDNLSLETLQCVRNSTTCAEVNACVTATPAEAAACTGATPFQCSGDVLVKCSFGTPLVFYDCAQDGQHCFQGAGIAACGTGTCDPTTTLASCQGDVLVNCTNIGTATEPSGVLVPTDCKKQRGYNCNGPGGQCAPNYADTCGVVGGAAQCTGSGAACEPYYHTPTCSGTVVTTCTGGKLVNFDCASLGPLTCVPTGSPDYCEAAGTECSDYGPDTCADGVITFCLFGTTTTVDCKSYGFSGCTTMAFPGQGTAAICAM